MPHRLATSDADFQEAFARFLEVGRDQAADVRDQVAAIIDDVRQRGDAAVIDYTARFDRFDVAAMGLPVSLAERQAAAEQVNADQRAALAMAAERIRAFHARQPLEATDYVDGSGVRLGARFTPIDAAGVYVPGGQAAYPSSVLMNVIPAQVAGVARIAMVVPTPDGVLNPLVMAAAQTLGIDEVYRIGGAQAVAGLAYGTETIPPVDKITGPGNAYVAEAKRQVFGQVGIDMIAGPSEILVVADSANDPAWIAADLLSQAEHDESAQSVLITDDGDFAEAVAQAVEGHLATAPRAATAGASWRDHGAIIVVGDLMADAPVLVDRIAPEHLELAVANPDALASKVRHAGAIFLGRHTPEAVGDYVAGPNHVLPTSRSARFSSGLSVLDFVKRTTFVSCTPEALDAVAPAAVTLAEAEGLHAHALSLTIRRNR